MADNKFGVDYAKRQAGCKKCKQKIDKGELRLAKITANYFSDEGEMKHYHHPACLFETFKRAKASTKVIEEPGDIEGWDDINESDKVTQRRFVF
jgi:DNA ligase-3